MVDHSSGVREAELQVQDEMADLCPGRHPLCPYLGFLLDDEAGRLGDGAGLQGSLGGGQDEVCVSLDHLVQVVSSRLTAVVHRDLIRGDQAALCSEGTKISPITRGDMGTSRVELGYCIKTGTKLIL